MVTSPGQSRPRSDSLNRIGFPSFSRSTLPAVIPMPMILSPVVGLVPTNLIMFRSPERLKFGAFGQFLKSQIGQQLEQGRAFRPAHTQNEGRVFAAPGVPLLHAHAPGRCARIKTAT